MLAFPLLLQIVWTAFVPLLFGVVRLIQGSFARDYWFSVSLDVSFALILGGMILTLGWVFRSVAANVDETRARAVESYAAAAAADAAEQERIAVAALMHDSVLAALIAAERADTPRERTLAVAMAREALTRLANTEQDAEEGSDEPRRPRASPMTSNGPRANSASQVRVERTIVGAHALDAGPRSPAPWCSRRRRPSPTRPSTRAAAGLAVAVEGRAAPAHVRIDRPRHRCGLRPRSRPA